MINLDRQLYYTYKGKRYKSKWLALQAASDEGFKGFEGYSKIGVALGNHLKPFSDANWDQEPEEDWIEMCRDRLQMIRDSTPFMILSFSGGSDSLFILELALKYNIKVDEILIYRDTMINSSFYDKGIHAGNYEIDKYAIPFVKNLSTKVTVTNSGINNINDYKSVTSPYHYLEDGWKLTLSITNILSAYMNRNLKEDKALIVRGVSEPQLYFDHSLKLWYNLSYDTDNFQALMLPGSVSFFTDPNYPKIHVKQCYLLRNYLKKNNLFTVSPKNNYITYKKAMVKSTRYLNSFNTYDSLYFDKNDSKLLKNQSPMISLFAHKKTKAFFKALKNHYTTNFNDYLNTVSKNKIDDITLINYPLGVKIHKAYLKG